MKFSIILGYKLGIECPLKKTPSKIKIVYIVRLPLCLDFGVTKRNALLPPPAPLWWCPFALIAVPPWWWWWWWCWWSCCTYFKRPPADVVVPLSLFRWTAAPPLLPLQPAAATADDEEDDDDDDEHVRTTADGDVRLTDTLKSIGADTVISIAATMEKSARARLFARDFFQRIFKKIFLPKNIIDYTDERRYTIV